MRVQGFGFRVRAHVLGHLLDVCGDQVEFRADLVELRLHLGQEPAPSERERFTDTDSLQSRTVFVPAREGDVD